MRILVTGSLGFVGRHLVPAARARGHEVTGSGIVPAEEARGMQGLAAYRVCDMRDPSSVERLLEETGPEAVVHLAAQASGAVAFADPVTTFDVNAGGTLHLLEAARRSSYRGRILTVTSSEAYGRIPLGRPADESTPLRPVSPYGMSKAAADAIAQVYGMAYGLQVIRARSFSHTGPGQAPDFVAPAWAKQVAEAEARSEAGEPGPFTIDVGNLDPVRDLGDVRDTVEAYLDLLDKGRTGEAYNVCTGQGLKLRDLLEAIRERARVPMEVRSDPERARPVDIPYLVGDRKKIAAAVGWKPKRPLAETLEALLDDWRARLGAGERAAKERA